MTHANATPVPTFSKGQAGITYKVRAMKLDSNFNADEYDISGFTTLQLEFKKEDGTIFKKTATYSLSGTKHFATYTNTSPEASILDQTGDWYVRITGVDANGDTIPFTDWDHFKVV